MVHWRILAVRNRATTTANIQVYGGLLDALFMATSTVILKGGAFVFYIAAENTEALSASDDGVLVLTSASQLSYDILVAGIQ